MGLILETAPTEEPISLEEAKAHLRVTHSDDDTLIEAMAKAARLTAENFTLRAFINQAWTLTLDAFPPARGEIRLPRPQLNGIVEISYLGTDGANYVLPSTDFVVDMGSEPVRLAPAFGKSWPATLSQISAVTIMYTAGWDDAASVPEDIKSAIKLILGHLYEHREAVTAGQPISEVPMAAEYLLSPYRAMGHA